MDVLESNKQLDSNYISFTVSPALQIVQTYWLGANGEPMRHFNALDGHVKKSNQDLVFAMNGGMFSKGYSPVGLYIEEGKELSALDTGKGEGNFYLMPNGVFYIDSVGAGHVIQTSTYRSDINPSFATQSGPMLLIDGVVHSAFRQNSTNLNIRNGVGILPDGRIHLAMSKRPVNFYSFANYFRKLGCKQALYLDGFVSRVFDPRIREDGHDGRFGVMIGVSELSRQ